MACHHAASSEEAASAAEATAVAALTSDGDLEARGYRDEDASASAERASTACQSLQHVVAGR